METLRHGYTDETISWGDEWVDPVVVKIGECLEKIQTLKHPSLSGVEIVEYISDSNHWEYTKYRMEQVYLGFSKQEVMEFGDAMEYLVRFYKDPKYGKYIFEEKRS